MRKKTVQKKYDRIIWRCVNLWNVFLNIITFFFLTLLLIYFLLPKLGFPFETVLTGSMEPAIGTEDLVLTDSYSRDPDPGDIAVFEQAGMRMIHRVIERTEMGYQTKGDANPEPDSFLVRKEQIKGRCIAVLKKGKQFAKFLRSPLFIAVTAGLCILQGSGSRQNEDWYGKNRGSSI